MGTDTLEKLLSELIGKIRINPKNLIGTILGDAIIPRGGSIWLSSLVELIKPFGIAEYLSRTTALRLVHDGWFETTRIGKHSYYSLTETHMERIREHYPLVYGVPTRAWSGAWYILLTSGVRMKDISYKQLREELRYEGIGQLAPHVFISAAETTQNLESSLNNLGLLGQVEIMKATALSQNELGLSRATIDSAWNISALEADYIEFLKQFRQIYQVLEASPNELPPNVAFTIRTLLIMMYRRIVLRDPRLPTEFLPANWAGYAAFTLCKNTYQAVLAASETHLENVVKTADGPIGPTSSSLYDRFGGLTYQHSPPKLQPV